MTISNTVKDGSGTNYWILLDTNGMQHVVGGAAHDAAATGNPLRIAGVYHATIPGVADGDVADLLVDAAGRPIVRAGGQTDFEALASAVRAASTNSADFTNIGAKGVAVCLDVTNIAVATTLTLHLQWLCPSSGNYEDLAIAAAAIAAVSTNTYILYPTNMSIPGGGSDIVELFEVPLPTTWRIRVVHSDANNITYSIGISYIT